MVRNAIILVASFFMVLVLLGCNQRRTTPVELVFGLKSYSSIDEVKSKITREGGDWNVVENNTLSAQDVRPKYEYIRVATNIFSDADHHGKTLLSFYNGQLMSVWFYADDWGSYKKYLEEKRNVAINDNTWDYISGNMHNWITTDYAGKYYIAWEDITLAEAMKKWIEKYS
jgi:hypothetical protein